MYVRTAGYLCCSCFDKKWVYCFGAHAHEEIGSKTVDDAIATRTYYLSNPAQKNRSCDGMKYISDDRNEG